MIRITPFLSVPDEAVVWRFVRASGPGGQNVNKVSSAVQLRVDVGRCSGLSCDVRGRLCRLAGSRLTKDGILIISASRFRTQERNRLDAEERLRALFVRALRVPTRRRPTKPGKAQKARRLQGKLHRGEIKKIGENPTTAICEGVHSPLQRRALAFMPSPSCVVRRGERSGRRQDSRSSRTATRIH